MDWDLCYKNNETPWEREGLHPSLSVWFGEHDLRGNIIIPGCGRSLEPMFFARKGFAVSMVDISAVAINAQKTIFANYDLYGEFENANILTWMPSVKADVVYEQTCLCALPPSKRSQYANQIENWLTRNGVFVANFLQKDEIGGPPYHCSIEEMKDLFPASKWNWSRTESLISESDSEVYELSYLLIKK